MLIFGRTHMQAGQQVATCWPARARNWLAVVSFSYSHNSQLNSCVIDLCHMSSGSTVVVAAADAPDLWRGLNAAGVLPMDKWSSPGR